MSECDYGPQVAKAVGAIMNGILLSCRQGPHGAIPVHLIGSLPPMPLMRYEFLKACHLIDSKLIYISWESIKVLPTIFFQYPTGRPTDISASCSEIFAIASLKYVSLIFCSDQKSMLCTHYKYIEKCYIKKEQRNRESIKKDRMNVTYV